MGVEADAGGDEVNLAGTRMHNMTKEGDNESGACGQEKRYNQGASR